MLFFAWTASLAYSLEYQVRFLLELSQIIVLGCKSEKTLSKFTLSFSAGISIPERQNCLPFV